MVVAIANVAAPLVCLDLLGHVVSIFFQGMRSREEFDFRRPRPGEGRYRAGGRSAEFLIKSGLAPRPEKCKDKGSWQLLRRDMSCYY